MAELTPADIIYHACRANVSGTDLDSDALDRLVFRAFPKITTAELAKAFREAGQRLSAEASALTEELPDRDRERQFSAG